MSREVGFADPASCLRCHAEAARGYARTGMAHAFSKPNSTARPMDRPADMTPAMLASSHVYHAASGTNFAMAIEDGRLWQRRWQTGPDGQPENEESLQVDEVMGSGNHARTYLHREPDGRLLELPLGWYAEDGGHFGMNPGFDNPHPATRRAISYECMSCHNAYPRTPDLTHTDGDASPQYLGELPQGIDCQRCHGPGQRHVIAAEAPNETIQEIRAAIVNPGRLSAERQMQVCEQCHLQTTSQPLPNRIRHFNFLPFSYAAGEPLGSAFSYFQRDPELEPPNNFEIVSAPFRLRQSRCFRESRGALTCETCHNPHNLQKGPAATEFFAKICLNCHAALSAKVAAGQHVASRQCVACHMPVRRTEDVVHVLMTDHLIQRRPTPPQVLRRSLAEVEVTAANVYGGPVRPYPGVASPSGRQDDLYTAVAQVMDDSNAKLGIPALSAAIRASTPSEPGFVLALGDAQQRVGDHNAAVDAYRQALAQDPLSIRTSRSLAVALADAGQNSEATAVLAKALALDPANAVLWYERGRIELQAGMVAESMAHLRKALELDPDSALAENALGLALARTGQLPEAEAAFRASLAQDPYSAEAEANLANLLALRQDWKAAAFYFEKAVRLAPDSIGTHSRYVSVLVELKDLQHAEQHARAVVALAPASCEADLQLGEVLGESGSLAGAQAQFERCLARTPENGRAHLDLGLLRLQRGDRPGAVRHLATAAAGRDRSVAEQAQAVLNQIRAH